MARSAGTLGPVLCMQPCRRIAQLGLPATLHAEGAALARRSQEHAHAHWSPLLPFTQQSGCAPRAPTCRTSPNLTEIWGGTPLISLLFISISQSCCAPRAPTCRTAPRPAAWSCPERARSERRPAEEHSPLNGEAAKPAQLAAHD